MDDKRFDHLTRLVGRGASRRSILKGLLGLGGTAVAGTMAADGVDARRVTSSSRIPPPPPPACPSGEQECGGTGSAFCCPYGKCNTAGTPDVCCDGAGESFCGTGCCAEECTDTGLCCPAGQDACRSICCAPQVAGNNTPANPNTNQTSTCARDGKTDYCCTTGFACGLDCCDALYQCCDGECCPDDFVCLARVFGEGPFVEEEVCCPVEETCRDIPTGEGRCCPGECFDPGTTVNGGTPLPGPLDPFDQLCCPAGGEVCAGTNGTLCCQGETPDCCIRQGEAICINEATQCCVNADCDELDDPANCIEGFCPRATQVCATRSSCETGETCCIGGDDECCPEDQECCGPVCCDAGFECCEREVQGVLTRTCIDPTIQCCVARDCFENFDFDQGCVACPPSGLNANTCVARREGMSCGEGDCDTCYQGQCIDTPCPTTTTAAPTTTTAAPACDPPCTTGQLCCPGPSGNVCVTGTICPNPTCDTPCPTGQQCCLGGYCIDEEDICCLAVREDVDCPVGSSCCGGRCEPGACCTGIADDGRCDQEICCPGANGNECVIGPTCEAPTTTTAAPACDPVTCAALSFCFPNGVWRAFTCIGDSCSSLPDQTCADGNICTTDSCDDATGCANAAVADGPAPSPATGVCCGGVHFPTGQCCGTDASPCANLGFDDECVVCESGSCVASNMFGACTDAGGGALCDENGQCVACFDTGHPCQNASQCCAVQFFNVVCNSVPECATE